MSLFYLMDSVVKNKLVGRKYQSFFSPRLYEIFTTSYTQTKDEPTKQRFLKLFKTWYYVFPHPILFSIDQFLKQQNQHTSIYRITQMMGRPPRTFLANPQIFRMNTARAPRPPTQFPHQTMHMGYPQPPFMPSHHPGPVPNVNVPMMIPQIPVGRNPAAGVMMSRKPPSPTTPTKDELQILAEEVESELKNKEEGRIMSLVDSLYKDFPLKCSKCGLRFRMQQNLDRHLDRHYDAESEQHFARRWWTKSSKEWVSKNELNSLPEILLNPTEVIFGRRDKVSEGKNGEDGMFVHSSSSGGTALSPPSKKNGKRKKKEKEEVVIFDVQKEKCVFCGGKIESRFHEKCQEWVFVDAIKVDPSEQGVQTKKFGLGENFFFVIHKDCGSSISRENIVMVLETEKKKVDSMSPMTPGTPNHGESMGFVIETEFPKKRKRKEMEVEEEEEEEDGPKKKKRKKE